MVGNFLPFDIKFRSWRSAQSVAVVKRVTNGAFSSSLPFSVDFVLHSHTFSQHTSHALSYYYDCTSKHYRRDRTIEIERTFQFSFYDLSKVQVTDLFRASDFKECFNPICLNILLLCLKFKQLGGYYLQCVRSFKKTFPFFYEVVLGNSQHELNVVDRRIYAWFVHNCSWSNHFKTWTYFNRSYVDSLQLFNKQTYSLTFSFIYIYISLSNQSSHFI